MPATANEYELQRLANIEANKKLLQELELNEAAADVRALSAKKKASVPSSKKRRATIAFKKEVEDFAPRRTSSRLKGIVADSEVAKQKAEDEFVALKHAETAKRQRVAGDMKLEDIVVSGRDFDSKSNVLAGLKGERYAPTFTEEDVKATTDKDLKALRQKMMGLKIHERFEPNELKIVPERIYSMAFHPIKTKQLVFAGDKLGSLGIFDASNPLENPDYIKDEDDETDSHIPNLTAFKLHSRTISTFCFDQDSAEALYSASYDGSIRKLDLTAQKSTEAFAGADDATFADLGAEAAISGVELADSHTLYFSTLDGHVGFKDLRSPSPATVWRLHDKKIGGMTLHPRARHLAATASLDRTVKIWDMRKIVKHDGEKRPHMIAEHTSKLSVSSAIWSSTGSVVTTSYDDTIKVYKQPDSRNWTVGKTFGEEEYEPDTVIKHNNQTGRWVTILRAQWQQYPTGIQKFCIGNMNRYVDIYSENGEQLAQLGAEGVTAVPAVAQFHPTQDWVCGGTASGKVCLWT